MSIVTNRQESKKLHFSVIAYTTTGFSDPEGNGLEIYRAIAAETARTDKNICLNFMGLYISRLQAFS